MLLKCDTGCGEKFEVEALGVEVVRDDIERTWFYCPHCEEQYTVCYTNDGIRRLQALHQESLKKIRHAKRNRLIRDLKKRIAKGMERLKKEMEPNS